MKTVPFLAFCKDLSCGCNLRADVFGTDVAKVGSEALLPPFAKTLYTVRVAADADL